MTGITQARLKELLHYDPHTGLLTWAAGPRLGKGAGCRQKVGYLVVRLDGVLHYAHRLAYLYVTGETPHLIDHVNGDRSDNRAANLRAATSEINNQNRRLPTARTKYDLPLGVSYDKRRLRYVAQIRISGKNTSLGQFACPEDAHQAYLKAKRELHAGCTI